MKKSLIALAAVAASGFAMAQSSVTLFGVVDAAVTHYNGEQNWNGLTTGATPLAVWVSAVLKTWVAV